MKVSWSQDTYIDTYLFAAQAHCRQLVPGTDLPYIVHVNLVTMEVIAALAVEKGHDENLAVQCALLHDVIEDTEITYEQVEAEFGQAVADGVLSLSKDKKLDRSLQLADSLGRIRKQPHAVWMVKLADRITNLQPPPHYWTRGKMIQYRAEAFLIHDALRDASPLLAARLMEKIEAFKKFVDSCQEMEGPQR